MSDDKKDINKKFEQKMALERVIRQSFKYQNEMKRQHAERTSKNLIEWNKDNLSPNGGKKAFKQTQGSKVKGRDGFLTKKD
jgi:hypothetical protein|tara:strand:- start:182 stop:424 length:243 start_codon:yes stop_codon:yes gene_type:complete